MEYSQEDFRFGKWIEFADKKCPPERMVDSKWQSRGFSTSMLGFHETE
jgi:hypothetical protein